MEWSTIHDDVCVLTITGTAATVRGLPDLAQAQRMWAKWELYQSVAIDDGIGEEHGGIGIGIGRGGVRNAYLPGDSSPGSVISMNADTPFSDTPFYGAESDNGGEGGHDDKWLAGGGRRRRCQWPLAHGRIANEAYPVQQPVPPGDQGCDDDKERPEAREANQEVECWQKCQQEE